jgi:hypothetical protein
VLLESAVRAGQATSDALARRFGTADPWRLAEALGIGIELRARCPDNPRLRSEALDHPQTAHRPPAIVLYLEALADMSRLLALRAPRLNCAPLDLDTVAVAVELYRCLEHARPDCITEDTRAWPRVAREVAAHAFTQDLLELPFFPAEIDAVDRLSRTPAHVRTPRR